MPEAQRQAVSVRLKKYYEDHPEARERVRADQTGRVHSEEARANMRAAQQKRVVEGRHNGWSKRGVESYAESFWRGVLDNHGIAYKQEVPVEGYFLDFVIGNVDLEIDGKQHTYPDRAASDQRRDKMLSKLGYSVYRISWINPNTEETKLQVKEQIESFLTYLEVRDGE